MEPTDRNKLLALFGRVALFFTGLLSVIWLINAGVQNPIIGESIWLGGGALMGVGLSLPFRLPLIGAIAGALLLGALQLGLMFLFRHGT